MNRLHIASERRLLFVGSGLSSALGALSWTEVLNRIATDTLPPHLAQPVIDLAKPGNEYQAADLLLSALGKRESLEDHVVGVMRADQDRIRRLSRLSDWTTLLQRAGNCGIITTNWDTLLPEICPGYQPIMWPSDVRSLAQYLRDGRPFILYLHGNIDNPPLTITRADCDRTRRLLSEEDFRLETLLAIHTLLVIGSSFPDSHLNDLYHVASRIAGHNSRVRVVLQTREAAHKFRASNPTLAAGSLQITFATHRDFRAALTAVVSACDPSDLLTTIPLIDPRSHQLYEIVSLQPYNFETTSSLRELYEESSQAALLLDLSAEFLADPVVVAERVTAGLFATVLSVTSDSWAPDFRLLDKLEGVCVSILRNGESPLIGMVEPLVFALATKGRREPHARYLDAVIHDDSWRRADIDRIGQYYENLGSQIRAVKRHIKDTRRRGLLLANDVTRLVNLLGVANLTTALYQIGPLLLQCITALYDGGKDSLARAVQRDAITILRERNVPEVQYHNVLP